MDNVKKTIIRSGENGTFTGTVEVRWADRKGNKTIHNRVLHEEETRLMIYHLVYGTIEGQKEVFRSNEFLDEKQVFQELEGVETAITRRLERLANVKIEPTVSEALKELGYK